MYNYFFVALLHHCSVCQPWFLALCKPWLWHCASHLLGWVRFCQEDPKSLLSKSGSCLMWFLSLIDGSQREFTKAAGLTSSYRFSWGRVILVLTSLQELEQCIPEPVLYCSLMQGASMGHVFPLLFSELSKLQNRFGCNIGRVTYSHQCWRPFLNVPCLKQFFFLSQGN